MFSGVPLRAMDLRDQRLDLIRGSAQLRGHVANIYSLVLLDHLQ